VFWLKKVVSYWLMPLPLCMALLAAAVLLLHLARRTGLARRLVLLALALLVLLSNSFVSTRLMRPLEGRYPAIPEFAGGPPAPAPIAGCRLIVVLGGGYSDMRGMSATSQLSSSALARIIEGVRILRVLPEARLVVSGPAEPGRPSLAAVYAKAAESLGAGSGRIELIETAHDTEDEAFAVARLAGGAPVALVTSAWHMPRAAGLFRKAGVSAVPCPTDYRSRADDTESWAYLKCDVESLERSTFAIHEWMGLLWLRLRGMD
jgi:uncharacterized SAM-binding protein YcdF (DUF218 family)